MKKEIMQKNSEDGAVLVTGSAGFIGKRLIKNLSDNGKTVVSVYHYRLPEPLNNVYPVCSDLGSCELLAAPLRGVDTVVHLAWEKNFQGPKDVIEVDPEYLNPPRNVLLIRNLVKAMELAGTKRIIFLSANGASRTSENLFLKEKYYAEFSILNSNIPEKIIIRPGIVYDGNRNHDRFINSILNIMRFPFIYPIPNCSEGISPLFLDDLITIISNSIDLEMTDSCAVIGALGPEKIAVEEIFKIIFDRHVKGTKIQLGGFLGDKCISFIEKKTKVSQNMPTISDFLKLGMNRSESLSISTPYLERLFPKDFQKFKEALNL
ncbi:MAG: NAD(P)H-binding protein [Oligoflexales bacterium]|nr:NAD(P)H-binding protein [Oligoflexales bacterium]